MAIIWKCENCKHKNDSLPIQPIRGPGIGYVCCQNCEEINTIDISYKQFCKLLDIEYNPLKPNIHNRPVSKGKKDLNNRISTRDIRPPVDDPLEED